MANSCLKKKKKGKTASILKYPYTKYFISSKWPSLSGRSENGIYAESEAYFRLSGFVAGTISRTPIHLKQNQGGLIKDHKICGLMASRNAKYTTDRSSLGYFSTMAVTSTANQ